jgi:acetyltransferase
MTAAAVRIERLAPPPREQDVRALAELLVDAVDSGAAVSFVAPLTLQRAQAWWRDTLAAVQRGAVVLVARAGAEIVGSVQLHPAWAPNQPHRADVAKLLVHRRARRTGVGTRLMAAVEDEALRAGLRLLVLDTRQGSAAEALYRRLGWREVGVIPDYALDPDGAALHATVVFYKRLAEAAQTAAVGR